MPFFCGLWSNHRVYNGCPIIMAQPGIRVHHDPDSSPGRRHTVSMIMTSFVFFFWGGLPNLARLPWTTRPSQRPKPGNKYKSDRDSHEPCDAKFQCLFASKKKHATPPVPASPLPSGPSVTPRTAKGIFRQPESSTASAFLFSEEWWGRGNEEKRRYVP